MKTTKHYSQMSQNIQKIETHQAHGSKDSVIEKSVLPKIMYRAHKSTGILEEKLTS